MSTLGIVGLWTYAIVVGWVACTTWDYMTTRGRSWWWKAGVTIFIAHCWPVMLPLGLSMAYRKRD